MNITVSEELKKTNANIKVIGVGGAGGNAVSRMAIAGLRGVQLIAANSDAQALSGCQAEICLQLGETLTKGLGVGGDPARGRAAAQESEASLKEVLAGADMVFVTAGMGGGTGTGGAPVVARLAKEAGALTIGVVTRPFDHEGMLKASLADAGVQELRQHVDTLLVIPNNRILENVEDDTTAIDALDLANDVLRKAVQSMSDVIAVPGKINVDLADLRSIMKNAGVALIGMAEAKGPGRALLAAKAAVSSPFLENVNIMGAKGILVNVTGSNAITMREINAANEFVKGQASPDAKIKNGHAYDETLGDTIRITVIATGLAPQCGNRRLLQHRPGQLAARYQSQAPGAVPDSRLAVKPRQEDWTIPAYLRLKVRKLK